MWLRSRLTASPPFRPARRASADENSWAVPRLWAARPPAAAISRWRCSLMPAKPRPPLDGRLVEARRPWPAVVALRELVRERAGRDFFDRDGLAFDLAVDRLRAGRLEDAFDADRFDLVSPFSRRLLFTLPA